MEAVYPNANHKHCLWHIPHTLKHLLYLEKLPVEEREALSSYTAYILKEKDFIKAQHVTSLVEREMREINRRTDIGCRWSKKYIKNTSNTKIFFS